MMRSGFVLAIALCAGCSSDDLGDDGMTHPVDQPVTVHITDHGAPRAGVQIYFQNLDSTVAGTTTTDAGGSASQLMAAGGFVTAIEPFAKDAAAHRIYTIANVQPGDPLVFDSAFSDFYDSANPAPNMVHVTLTVPTAPGAAAYQVACAGYFVAVTPGAPVTRGLVNCPASADLLVSAADAAGTLVGSFWAKATPISEGGTVDLSSHTYETRTSVTFTSTKSLTNVDHGVGLVTPQGAFGGSSETRVSDTSATFQVAKPDGGNVVATMTLTDDPRSNYEIWQFGPTATDVAFDSDTQQVMPVAFHGIDPANGATWTADGPGMNPDFVLVRANVGSTVLTPFQWWLASPVTVSGAASSAQFPVLPDPALAIPSPGAAADQLERWVLPGGWDTARPTIFQAPPFLTVGTTGSGFASCACPY